MPLYTLTVVVEDPEMMSLGYMVAKIDNALYESGHSAKVSGVGIVE